MRSLKFPLAANMIADPLSQLMTADEQRNEI